MQHLTIFLICHGAALFFALISSCKRFECSGGEEYQLRDRWAAVAGRYEGAKAEKAVPSPSVCCPSIQLIHSRAASSVWRPLENLDLGSR
jgi:hypothetical protein